jgi:hypothetical protein
LFASALMTYRKRLYTLSLGRFSLQIPFAAPLLVTACAPGRARRASLGQCAQHASTALV